MRSGISIVSLHNYENDDKGGILYQIAIINLTTQFSAREDIANFDMTTHGAQWELHKRVIIDHEVAHLWFGNLVTSVCNESRK